MLVNHSFEIRVALVGYVSVGKSTVLNALLGDKFSQVSMRRTTAGVNFFRIANKNAKKTTQSSNPTASIEWSANDEDRAAKSAMSTHGEISEDNKTLRSSNAVHEKTFDIEMDNPICEMRDDTQLVLIDIPGINEADSSNKYREYVTRNWGTFDCVVVVMDAIQGVNTEEQVELLRFVRKNNRENKDLPTIILGNKMDDIHDAEKMEIVDESRSKVVEIFGEGCSAASLEKLIEAATGGSPCANKTSAFIPISAMTAFMYRMAAHLSFEQFKVADKTLIDKIGREELGRKWNKLSAKGKYEAIQEAVSDPEEYKERLSSSNFDTFLTVFSHLMGGKETQTKLLTDRLHVKLNLLSYKGGIVDRIKAVYDESKSIGKPIENLPYHFWRLYYLLEEEGYGKFKNEADPSALKRPFDELVRYLELAKMYKWASEEKSIVDQAKRLLKRQLSFILEKVDEWKFSDWYAKSYKAGEGEAKGTWTKSDTNLWSDLSPIDWMTLLSSVLLPSNRPHFVENFGEQKVTLERWLTFFTTTFDPKFNEYCTLEGARKVLQDTLMEKNEDNMKVIVRLKMPELLSEPTHWGHLSREFCDLCRMLKMEWNETFH